MSDLFRLIIRMFAISFGFFLGCLAAGLAYAFLARLIRPEDFGRFSDIELTVTLVIGVVGVASLFARAALLPAFILIAVFEFWRRRDWLSHALAGGAIALAAASMVFATQSAAPSGSTRLIAVQVACGIIGASVYWLFVGRNAGRWLPSERRASADITDPRP